MAKLVCDEMLDAALQYLEDNADWISVCEGAPTTYEHAHSHLGTATGKVLAHSSTPTFTGPAPGAVSGRKTTIDEEATITIDISSAGGGADHVALCDVGSTKLLYVTTCTAQALVATNTVTIPAWTITIPAPT